MAQGGAMKLHKFTGLTLLILILGGCMRTTKPIDTTNMDLSVKPGNNFYQYANGSWIKNHPIPDEYGRYGAFEVLGEKNKEDVKQVIDDIITENNATSGSLEQKIRDFYLSGMDTSAIEASALSDLQAEFDAIDKIESYPAFQQDIAHLHEMGLSPLFGFFVDADPDDSKMKIAHFYQAGLGLPDRDYYLNEDNRSKEIRTAYIQHLQTMFELLGETEERAQKAADVIMSIETQLAEVSNTRLENRDPIETFHKMDLSQLQKKVPVFKWTSYFEHVSLPTDVAFNVRQPRFFEGMQKIITHTTLPEWQTYLKWNVINGTAPYLNKEIVDADFNFYGAVLSGKKAQKERWKRVQSATSNALGEAVGQLYVARFFPPEAKERMVTLVGYLKNVMESRITNLDWMQPETKTEALKKLEAMRVKVGYPDKWIDYSGLDIDRSSYVLNVLRANRFETRRQAAKVGKPVEPYEWEMTPQTVNAYHHPLNNEIVFPAAILQPPFFYLDGDDAVNYGAIGMVIGHEMTHAFDDKGRNYDANGDLKNWWTESDAALFKEKSQILVDQFNSFTVLDTLHVDGELTLGENIADLGGMSIAYEALQRSFAENGHPEMIDGLSAEQRFFLAQAQVWRQNIRNEELMRRIKEDVHSPGPFRVNGPVSNMEEFYTAFDVQPGDSLYRPVEQRAKIW